VTLIRVAQPKRVTRSSCPDSRLSDTFSIRLVRTLFVERVVASTIVFRVFFSASFTAVRADIPPLSSTLTPSTVNPTLPPVFISSPLWWETSLAMSVTSRRLSELSVDCSVSIDVELSEDDLTRS
jgi:hypothetical protein